MKWRYLLGEWGLSKLQLKAGFVEAEFRQLEDFEGDTELVANLLFGDDGRAGIVRFTRVAGQDQTAGAGGQFACHRPSIEVGIAATDGMVTTAIEKELKWTIQIRQIEHVGDHKMRLNSGGRSAALRLLHGQRRHVDTGHLKALLRKPDTIASRATANFESSTRLNRVSADNTL